MLFVFRTLSFFILGAILLTPAWLFNTRLDRVMPPSALALPHTGAANAELRERIVEGLTGLKQEIHTDMCRHEGRRLCLLTVCLPPFGADFVPMPVTA